jgi:hypothetical protein
MARTFNLKAPRRSARRRVIIGAAIGSLPFIILAVVAAIAAANTRPADQPEGGSGVFVLLVMSILFVAAVAGCIGAGIAMLLPRRVLAAGWLRDPLMRHELRYWDGSVWTDHVADLGRTGEDPLADAALARLIEQAPDRRDTGQAGSPPRGT